MNVHLTDEDRVKIAWIKTTNDDFVFYDDESADRCADFIELYYHLMNEDERGPAMRLYKRIFTDRVFREAKQNMELGLDKGTHCPLCNRFIKRYKRKMNSGMSRALIWLFGEHRETGKRWIRVADVAPTHVRRSNEISRLCLWGLVKEKSLSDEEDRKTSGLYRITNDGEDFVNGKLEVPSHVFLVNNNVEGFSENRISIREALGSKFSYNELMGIFE